MIQFFQDVWRIAVDNRNLFLQGIGYTMLIALSGTIFGLLIGLILGIIRSIPKPKNGFLRVLMKIINFIISAYVEIFRGTPMMVQAMIIFWGYAFAMGGKTLPLIPAGIVIVSINTGAYMTEIVRGGIISIDKGQLEGAYSIGMSHVKAMFYVIIPQALRNILPSVSNEFVINIKDTSVLNVIGVTELYFFANKISKMTWEIFETYVVVCVIYFALTFAITRLLRLVEGLMDGKDNYTVFGSQTDPNAEIKVRGGGDDARKYN